MSRMQTDLTPFYKKILNKLKKDLTLLLKVLYNNICSEKTAEHLIGVVGIEPQFSESQPRLFYRLNYYPIFRCSAVLLFQNPPNCKLNPKFV